MPRKKTLTSAQRIANQDKYNRAYHAQYYRSICLALDKRTTGDVIEWLDAQPSKAQAVIALVRKELNNNSK